MTILIERFVSIALWSSVAYVYEIIEAVSIPQESKVQRNNTRNFKCTNCIFDARLLQTSVKC